MEQPLIVVHFINVGQGDCIALQWQHDDGTMRLGIIDCNEVLHPHGNEYLYKLLDAHRGIEFLVMSHPHDDHFSGIPALVEYCDQRQYPIRYFLHTLGFHPDRLTEVLRQSSTSLNDAIDLTTDKVTRRVLKKIIKTFEARKAENRTKVEAIDDGKHLYLNQKKNLHLHFIAPNMEIEGKKFLQKAFELNGDEIKKKARLPLVNLLSTVICIHTDQWQLLLTSDAPRETLSRLGEEERGPFHDPRQQRTVAFQIPHHGSKDNHKPEFWEKILSSNGHPPTLSYLSVGENHYGHPHHETLAYFHKNTAVHPTNFVMRHIDWLKENMEGHPSASDSLVNGKSAHHVLFVYEDASLVTHSEPCATQNSYF